ncbi:MAG TPA: hypothetical protein VEN99_13430, partial [Acidimicrobiia bacterium]|nr:hypothetical protein [Acidimicrobiia bacterium]
MSTSAAQRLIGVALMTGAVLVGAVGTGVVQSGPFAAVTAWAEACPPAGGDPNQPPADPNAPPA